MLALRISEIFFSIQGESTRMGCPCVFVRLTYCNLRCTYCDTAYAFAGGTDMSIDEIINTVEGYGCRLVEITGGEPLAQSAVLPLMTSLCDRGFEVLLETGGSLDIAAVDARVKRIMDLKCPSSGMHHRNLWTNLAHLRETDEVKFVIGTREDFDWAVGVIRRHSLTTLCPVLMSVVFGVLVPQDLAEWILAERIGVRFQLQMHKFIWEPSMRGV